MLLSKLLNTVDVIQVLGEPEKTYITAITNDSRVVGKGKIFVAIEGYKKDGHNFIEEAISKGVSAIVLENDEGFPDELFSNAGVVKILVKNSRKTLSQISYELQDKPSHKLKLIGITGTKGKTTTGFIIKHLLEASGHKVGLIGTIANYIGDEKLETKLTTPESYQIHELMSAMVEAGCTHCVMEVSSHALELYRVDALQFDIAIFTNITADHFDFHGSFPGYLKAKKRLFDMLSPTSTAILNIDDDNWFEVIADSNSTSLFYGTGPSALYQMQNISYDINGTSFELIYADAKYDFTLNLIGSFNAYNATAAVITARQCGVDWSIAKKALSSFPQVPGRFEVVERKNKKVIVDYSHTTDSLKKALETLNSLIKGERKIYTVFGCGGDRDESKRPEMGKVAERGSDVVIITSDNPRTEEPGAIIRDIEEGLQLNNHKVVENREEAIKYAITESEEDAVVLIAGKGHEDYQEINGIRHSFSDKQKAEEYLALC